MKTIDLKRPVTALVLAQSDTLVSGFVSSERSQWRNGFRILCALCLAPVVTFFLMLLMNALIEGDLPEPQGAKPPILPNIFHVEEPIAPTPPPRKKEIDEVEPPPPVLRNRDIAVDGGVEIDSGDFGVVAGPVFDPSLLDSDSPVRLVTVAPQYPVRALGVEGYVDVRFDVTKAGTTENLEIIGYEPSTIFNRAVLRAVSRWRYQPKLVNGEPIVTKGVMERVSFKMED